MQTQPYKFYCQLLWLNYWHNLQQNHPAQTLSSVLRQLSSERKFANGAITGAFSRVFNDERHKNPTAEDFLQEESRKAGQLFTTSGGQISAELAQAEAAGRYLAASLATKREVAWRVYELADGTYTFTYPNISEIKGSQLALPARLKGLSFDSFGHTHWDNGTQFSGINFSQQDWTLITQGSKRGYGMTGYVAGYDGKLRYSTPSHSRDFGRSVGAKFMPPYKPYLGKEVPYVNLNTTY